MISIGVDLGQRRDYSAVAVVERIETAGYGFDHLHWMTRAEGLPDEWVVRHLERMALGTAYTAVTARVVEVARHPKVRDDCPARCSHTVSAAARDKAASTSLRSLTVLSVLLQYASAR